jgi:hypothetical protein
MLQTPDYCLNRYSETKRTHRICKASCRDRRILQIYSWDWGPGLQITDGARTDSWFAFVTSLASRPPDGAEVVDDSSGIRLNRIVAVQVLCESDKPSSNLLTCRHAAGYYIAVTRSGISRISKHHGFSFLIALVNADHCMSAGGSRLPAISQSPSAWASETLAGRKHTFVARIFG